jgi:hypothetical protein
MRLGGDNTPFWLRVTRWPNWIHLQICVKQQSQVGKKWWTWATAAGGEINCWKFPTSKRTSSCARVERAAPRTSWLNNHDPQLLWFGPALQNSVIQRNWVLTDFIRRSLSNYFHHPFITWIYIVRMPRIFVFSSWFFSVLKIFTGIVNIFLNRSCIWIILSPYMSRQPIIQNELNMSPEKDTKNGQNLPYSP